MTFWDYIVSAVKKLCSFTTVVFSGIAYGVNWVINTVLERIISLVDDLTSLVNSAAAVDCDASWLGLANFFFPLDDLFTYAGIALSTWAVCCLYRLIKSYIPTIS